MHPTKEQVRVKRIAAALVNVARMARDFNRLVVTTSLLSGRPSPTTTCEGCFVETRGGPLCSECYAMAAEVLNTITPEEQEPVI